jgi:GINS complex subunit 1
MSVQHRPLGFNVRNLLLELKRGSGGDATASDSNNYVLPAYNDVLVQTCLDEMNGHIQDMEDQAQAVTQQQLGRESEKGKTPMSVRPSLLLQQAAVQRHKRCLLTYHVVRLHAIQDMYWQQGSGAAAEGGGLAANENLSPLEFEFQQKYHKLIQQYGNAVDLDLHSFPTPPLPQDRVQVRVVREDVFGEDGTIALESGASVTFSKGSTHYLYYSDVEEYLQQGYLILLDGEEQDL